MVLRDRWAHVAALVPRFAKVRAQEHKWRAAEDAARARAKAARSKGNDVALDVEDVGDTLSKLSL
ncbi:hypothetical protein TRAPUB_8672 [Trametes pubescens]|uniref:Uncharacterized protein n=1 Tax=Trametes pubescens TaxID=154538 RepID=A0A1M2W4I5_TRAPU|nr:hypothetical protein TRAPUB_8672 [Trametes pubescens]